MGYARLNLSLKRNRNHTKMNPTLGITFNPSTRELKTGMIWLGGERTIMWKETGAQCNLSFGGNSCNLTFGGDIVV